MSFDLSYRDKRNISTYAIGSLEGKSSVNCLTCPFAFDLPASMHPVTPRFSLIICPSADFLLNVSEFNSARNL